MRSFTRQLWRTPSPLFPLNLDGVLVGGCAALMALGLIMVTSGVADLKLEAAGSRYYYLNRQLIHLAFGLFLGGFVLLLPLHFWQKNKTCLLLILVSFVVLSALLLFSPKINNAKRWFDLGLFSVQPTELVKLAIIIVLASYLVRRNNGFRTRWAGLLIPIIGLIFIGALIAVQPELGSAAIIASVVIGMLFIAGVNIKRLLIVLVICITLLYIAVTFSPHAMARFDSFFESFFNAEQASYQIRHSLVAFARGGWFGVGLGESVQKQLYLPEAYTDFIFAILGEELGLVGTLSCLLLFAFVCWRAFFIGVNAERVGQPFAALIAYGIALLWIVQVLANVAVTLNVAPAKGLALLFISYGGSALLAACIALGLLLRIDWETRQLLKERTQQSVEDLPDWLKGLRYD